MSSFELTRFSSPEQLAATVARLWFQDLMAAGRTKECVALSGGRIARLFLRACAEQGQRNPAALARVHFFWGDERCVPPDDPESNYGLARECLLGPLSIPDRQVHRIKGEAGPERAAMEAVAELCQLAPQNEHGQPVLDLVLLGMGEDGHVASLFPEDEVPPDRPEPVFRAVVASKPPPRRITIGYQTLAAAREVWVLASGAGKGEALRNSLAPGGLTPLAKVLQSRSATRVFTDVPAET